MADTPNLVTITVNGRKLSVPAGTLLIEACKSANVEVPSFCYSPSYSLQAACRMCLVEIEKMPKLATACTVQVSEGMVVNTESEKVVAARKSALEFILTNHPLDCPVCDAGGECELQDMTFRYGAAEGRFVEPKRHRDEQQWSPVVYYDRPRCILCYRCVRACGEGMDVWALGISNRGVASTIIPNQEDHLECEECGACIDICPVGALTAGPYRYKTRPWEMRHVGTTCTFCADGCRTTLGVRNDQIVRGDNRDRSGINGEFLCGKGRYAVDVTQSAQRLKQPLMRVNGELRPVSWSHALRTVATRFQEIRQAGGGFGAIGSNHASNEESYQLQKFARVVLGTNNIDHHRTADYAGFYAALAAAGAAGQPLAPAQALKTAKAVLLIGGDPTLQNPLIAWNIRWGYRLSKTRLYVLNRRAIKLQRQAYRTAVVPAGTEGQAVRFLAGEGEALPAELIASPPASDKRWPILPKSHPARIQETLQDFRARLRQEEDVIVVFGAELGGEDLRALVELGEGLHGRTRYIALADYANAHGAADLGLHPHLLPGYASVLDAAARERYEKLWGAKLPELPGRDLDDMIDGMAADPLAALYVVGANPFRLHRPDGEALRKTFLVVQDLFLTETAERADVVLPALSAYEKSGTVTNTCGEVQLLRRGGGWEGGKSDLEVIHSVAALMGADWGAPDPDRIFNEIRQHVPGYNVSLVRVLAGHAELTSPPPHAAAVPSRPALLRPNHDTLFTAGTLGRYSDMLNAVLEKRRMRPSDPTTIYPGLAPQALPETVSAPAPLPVEKGAE